MAPQSDAIATPRPEPRSADSDGPWARQSKLSFIIYWGIHALAFLALFTGVSAGDLVLFAVTVLVRIFAITAGYHRYFAHRTYRTSRAFQLVLGVLGATATQKGPLWWSSIHRQHHLNSDGPEDPHSPRVSFWYAHQQWIFDPRWGPTQMERVKDLARFPELLWLNRWHVVPPAVLALMCFLIGGLSGFVWGFAISNVVVWHSTYCINSLTHRMGRPRYDTGDDSRNSFLLALLTLGEGWHNNHHYYQSSTRQGFFWWEIDLTYYILRGLQALGIVWDIREVPDRVLYEETLKARSRAATAGGS